MGTITRMTTIQCERIESQMVLLLINSIYTLEHMICFFTVLTVQLLMTNMRGVMYLITGTFNYTH